MADPAHRFVSALDGAVAAGRHGRSAGEAGVSVSEVREAGLALVTARKGQGAGLLAAARSAFAVDLPTTPRWVAGPEAIFIWSGPDQWLAYRRAGRGIAMENVLAPLAGLAAIVDQSHARTILRVSGPRVRDALAKGIAIDLHPRAFKTGDSASTLVAHIAVQLWQIDEAPTYELAVARGFALSFWHWLDTSAAEFGLDLLATAPSI